MTAAKKVRGTAVSMPAGIVIGVGVSLLATCTFVALLTWLALTGKIEEKAIGYCSMVILLLASMMGALLSAIKVKRRWMLVCLMTGMLYFLILVASTAVFFGGKYQGIGVTGLMVLTGSVASGTLGLKRNRSGDKHYKQYRTC